MPIVELGHALAYHNHYRVTRGLQNPAGGLASDMPSIRVTLIPGRNSGKMLLCRTLVDATPARMGFLSAKVEDEFGDTEFLHVFHRNAECAGWLAAGTVVLLIEPLLVREPWGSQALRVETEAEMLRIDVVDNPLAGRWATHGEISSEGLLAAGEELLASGDRTGAEVLFRRSLRLEGGPLEARARLGLARCLALDGRFSVGLREAETARRAGADVGRLIGDCLYGLGEWEAAAAAFAAAGCEDDRPAWRLEEARTGNFDWDSLITGSTNDFAEFTGAFLIRDAPGKGRGCFASRALPAGELLVVERSLGVTKAAGRFETLGLKRLGSRPQVASLAPLVEAVLRNLERNPQLHARFHELSSGPSGCAAAPAPGVIDATRIEEVCCFNCFSMGYGATLLGRCSMFNHSCRPNVWVLRVGEVGIARAIRPVREGEELMTTYCDIDDAFEVRQRELLRCFGFACQCERCTGGNTVSCPAHLQPAASRADWTPEALATFASEMEPSRMAFELAEFAASEMAAVGAIMKLWLAMTRKASGKWRIVALLEILAWNQRFFGLSLEVFIAKILPGWDLADELRAAAASFGVRDLPAAIRDAIAEASADRV